MTFEEMERTMQFILEQQAQLIVNQAKAEEKAEERAAKAEERFIRIEAIQENTARQIEHLGDALVELTEAHTRTHESLGELAESHARTQGALRELAESQMHSDRRLDALIDIVRGGRETGQ